LFYNLRQKFSSKPHIIWDGGSKIYRLVLQVIKYTNIKFDTIILFIFENYARMLFPLFPIHFYKFWAWLHLCGVKEGKRTRCQVRASQRHLVKSMIRGFARRAEHRENESKQRVPGKKKPKAVHYARFGQLNKLRDSRKYLKTTDILSFKETSIR